MDRILIILKKENGPRASSAPALGLNTIIFKHVYWYMQQTQVSVYRTIGPLVFYFDVYRMLLVYVLYILVFFFSEIPVHWIDEMQHSRLPFKQLDQYYLCPEPAKMVENHCNFVN